MVVWLQTVLGDKGLWDDGGRMLSVEGDHDILRDELLICGTDRLERDGRNTDGDVGDDYAV